MQKNEEGRKLISESQAKIADFLDTMQFMVPGGGSFYGMKVKAMFKLAAENLRLIDTELVLDSGPVIVEALQDMAVLSAFALVFKLRLPGCDKPAAYKAHAYTKKPKNMGEMFLSKCEKMDSDLECIKTNCF